MTGGLPDRATRPDATLLRLVQSELQAVLRDLLTEASVPDARTALRAALDAVEKAQLAQEIRMPPETLAKQTGTSLPDVTRELASRIEERMKQQIPSLPGEKVPDYASLVRDASAALAGSDALPGAALSHSLAEPVGSWSRLVPRSVVPHLPGMTGAPTPVTLTFKVSR